MGKFPKVWVWDYTQDFCSTIQGASPQVLFCQSSQENLPMQRGTHHEKPRKTRKQWQRFAEQLGSRWCHATWQTMGILYHPCLQPLLPAGKRSTKWGTLEWCFLCDGLQMGLLKQLLKLTSDFSDSQNVQSMKCFWQTETAWCGIICYTQKCQRSPDSGWFCIIALAVKTTG